MAVTSTKPSERKLPRRNMNQQTTSGGKGGGNNPHQPNNSGGGHQMTQVSSSERYRIGMMVGIAAVLMMFVGLTSAYIVRALSPRKDWVSITMPSILWASTTLIFISSVTFEAARKYLLIKRFSDYSRWLFATAGLGGAFIVLQLWAWRQLAAQGVYLSSNPHSAFFYLLTALHALHLLGGIIALGYLVNRALKEKVMDEELYQRRIGGVGAARMYWHFLTVLWAALFGLLFFWK